MINTSGERPSRDYHLRPPRHHGTRHESTQPPPAPSGHQDSHRARPPLYAGGHSQRYTMENANTSTRSCWGTPGCLPPPDPLLLLLELSTFIQRPQLRRTFAPRALLTHTIGDSTCLREVMKIAVQT